MEIRKAEFVVSNTDVKKCPKTHFPEFAFIGRSNVGKSSLINMLVNKKDLALTSSKPGKTQLINHFIINDAWYLVDLPGYGYAKVARSSREQWEAFIADYILERKNLVCVFVLIDSRIEIQPIDAQFMQWLGEHEIPFCILFTKTDKLTKNELAKNLSEYENRMLGLWEEMPDNFISSSENKVGRKEILAYIEENIKLYNQHMREEKKG
jgi:GTP-binding protein